MKKILLVIFAALTACSSPSVKKEAVQTAVFISTDIQKEAVDSVKAAHPDVSMDLLEKGVRHASSLWRKEDGTPKEFISFVSKNYLADPAERKSVFNKISFYFESLNGNFNEITLDLRKILDLSAGKIDEVDRMFGNYSVSSHMQDDFY